jgi:hypothetical protein
MVTTARTPVTEATMDSIQNRKRNRDVVMPLPSRSQPLWLSPHRERASTAVDSISPANGYSARKIKDCYQMSSPDMGIE